MNNMRKKLNRDNINKKKNAKKVTVFLKNINFSENEKKMFL